MRKYALLAGFVAMLFVMSAFAALPAKSASAATAQEDVLYIAMQQDMEDFNYWNLASNSVWKANVIGFAHESLAGLDYDMKPFPLLAEDWTFWPGNLTVDIKLREGVKFHDGTTMTSEDVYYSYMILRQGTTAETGIVYAFDEDGDGVVSKEEIADHITIIDTYRIRMKMAGEGYGQFFTSTLGVSIIPWAYWNNPGRLLDNAEVPFSEMRMDVNHAEVAAAVGTGAFKYDSGARDSYRIMTKFEDYWGKDFLTPAEWPTYPKVVDTLHYKIYANVDTAVLALQGGEVDYIAWAITPGRVPALQADPRVGLEYMSDSGYFYVAFNMKKEPMNNLSFRQAVSHVIDKARIVDSYMAGFGQAGSAAVAPFFMDWHNPAVTKYPFDLDIANDILDEAGYVDTNGDGWRQLPDGSLMEKITLMTPPTDYDPIRERAGKMIATNMREVGINVEAKPIDFSTLVAKLVSFDYQMLLLGWRFTASECVSVLFDIYGPTAASNSWAFWSEEHPNPAWSAIGGVSTLADEATQDLANQLHDLEQDARKSFDIAEQIDLVKQGQEIVALAIPCDVLYYRVNVEAYSKTWTNWSVWAGTLINSYCFNVLDYSGTGRTTGGGAVTETLAAGLTLPGKVKSGESVDAYVMAIDNMGRPVAGADVDVVVAGTTVTAAPATGTTGTDGTFAFELTGTDVGVSVVTVNVTSGDLEASDSATITTTTLGGIAAVITPAKVSLTPGESMNVQVKVTDVNKAPVAGATVTIDPYLLGYGSISPDTIVTNAAGAGTMVYTAPEEHLVNQHMLVTLAATVTHGGYTFTNLATNTVIVYNDEDPDWRIVSIEDVTRTGLLPGNNVTTISVKATDAFGDPLASERLHVEYSNASMVVAPVQSVLTDAAGEADVVVQVKDLDDSGALRVRIGNMSVANSIADVVTLTYYVAASPPSADMYGGYITYDLTKFLEPWGEIGVTVHVNDHENNPADGINATVIMPGTAHGQLVEWEEWDWTISSLWEYVGILVETEADGQSIAVSGAFLSDVVGWAADYMDFWYGYVAEGALIESGVYEMSVYGADLASLDTLNEIHVIPGSWCWAEVDGPGDPGTRDDWGPWPVNFVIEGGQTLISSHFGYEMATEVVGVVYDIEKPVLEAKETEFDTTSVTVTVKDQDNQPVEGASVRIYQASNFRNTDYYVEQSEITKARNWAYYPDVVYTYHLNLPHRTIALVTPENGTVRFDVVAAAWNPTIFSPYPGSVVGHDDGAADLYTVYDQVCRASQPDLYVRGSYSGAYTLLSQTTLVIEPLKQVAYAEFDPVKAVKKIGDALELSCTVLDEDGVPLAGLPVSLAVSLGTATTPEVMTDGSGVATFSVDTSDVSDTVAAFVAAELMTGGAPEGATARILVAVMNDAPTIEVGWPAADGEVAGADVSVRGAIFDTNGLASATIRVDGGAAVSLPVTAGAMSVAIDHELTGLALGDHTIVIVATDSLGVQSTLEVDFTTVEDAKAKTDWVAWGLAIAGWVIVATLLLLVFMKRKPSEPEAATPGEPEVEPEAEPEPPPEKVE